MLWCGVEAREDIAGAVVGVDDRRARSGATSHVVSRGRWGGREE